MLTEVHISSLLPADPSLLPQLSLVMAAAALGPDLIVSGSLWSSSGWGRSSLQKARISQEIRRKIRVDRQKGHVQAGDARVGGWVGGWGRRHAKKGNRSQKSADRTLLHPAIFSPLGGTKAPTPDLENVWSTRVLHKSALQLCVSF